MPAIVDQHLLHGDRCSRGDSAAAACRRVLLRRAGGRWAAVATATAAFEEKTGVVHLRGGLQGWGVVRTKTREREA